MVLRLACLTFYGEVKRAIFPPGTVQLADSVSCSIPQGSFRASVKWMSGGDCFQLLYVFFPKFPDGSCDR